MFKGAIRTTGKLNLDYTRSFGSFFYECDDYSIYFEGFIFDLDETQNEKEYILDKLDTETFGKDFLLGLNGVFRIIFYSKIDSVVSLASDHLASKKIFYKRVGGKFEFSSSLFSFDINYPEDISINNIYFFLALGFYESGESPIANILQVRPGEYISYALESKELSICRYHKFNTEKSEINNYDSLLSKIDGCLQAGIRTARRINNNIGRGMSSSLSGGLDAKTIVAMIKKIYPDESLTTFTFAQNASSDDIISRDVAAYYRTNHVFQSLDSSEHLYSNVDPYIENTNGMIGMHGSLHTYNTYNRLNHELFGVHLSGQIGDVVFGSAIKDNFDIKTEFDSISYCGVVPDFLKEKIKQNSLIIDRYKGTSFEIFNIEQRQSNGTLNGDFCVENMFSTFSPFYNKELIQLSLSIPNYLRKHEKLYLDYLSLYYPQVIQFKWDKAGIKPKFFHITKIMKTCKTIVGGIKRRLGMKYDHMNPFDLWMLENNKIEQFLDDIFLNNIGLLDFDREFKENVEYLYSKDSDKYKRRKFVVVTLLLMLQKFSIK